MGEVSPPFGISNWFIWSVPVEGIKRQEKQDRMLQWATVTIDSTIATDKRRIWVKPATFFKFRKGVQYKVRYIFHRAFLYFL